MTDIEELNKPRPVLSNRPNDGYRWIAEIGFFVDSAHTRIIQEILAELVDAKYKVVDHGKLYTRNRGCRGPLCRYALRSYNRSLRRIHAEQDRRLFRTRKIDTEFVAADQLALMFIAVIQNPQIKVRDKDKLVSIY